MATMDQDTTIDTGTTLGRLVRREPGLVAIAVMALAGLGVAVYLTAQHYLKVPLVCTTGGVVDCSNVLHSQYSVVPGTQLPITFPGMLWFLVSGGLAIAGLVWARREAPEPQRLSQLQLAWSALGLLSVLYLVYDEIVQIHRICEWCTVVHVLILLTLLVALSRFQRVQAEQGSASSLAAARAARARSARTPSTARATSATAAGATKAHDGANGNGRTASRPQARARARSRR